jgi:hypothetical protein
VVYAWHSASNCQSSADFRSWQIVLQKSANGRWQVTIPAIAMVIQLSVVQDTVSRFGHQKFCADFGPINGAALIAMRPRDWLRALKGEWCYCVEIKPPVVTTIQRLPQRVIESILPTPGT